MGLIGMPLNLIPGIQGTGYFNSSLTPWFSLRSATFSQGGAVNLQFLGFPDMELNFDSSGRLIKSVRSGHPQLSFSYTYYPNGHMKEKVSDAKPLYKYDENGLQEEVRSSFCDISHVYDKQGRLLCLSRFPGDLFSFSYPACNKVRSTRQDGMTEEKWYDDQMRLIKYKEIDDSYRVFGYDDVNRCAHTRIYDSTGKCLFLTEVFRTKSGVISKMVSDGIVTMERFFNFKGQVTSEVSVDPWPPNFRFEYHNGHLHKIFKDSVSIIVIPKF
jgi:hypothetical protein